MMGKKYIFGCALLCAGSLMNPMHNGFSFSETVADVGAIVSITKLDVEGEAYRAKLSNGWELTAYSSSKVNPFCYLFNERTGENRSVSSSYFAILKQSYQFRKKA